VQEPDLVAAIGTCRLNGLRAWPRAQKLGLSIGEVAIYRPSSSPFCGKSAFAHKGGVHVSAILRNPAAYEHIDPELVGNRRRVLVSDLAGKSNIEYKAREMGINLGGNGFGSEKIVKEVKRLEDQGFQFDAAEGSLELLMKKVTGQFGSFNHGVAQVTMEKNRSDPAPPMRPSRSL
jgi:2-isopropylmalate synthase